MNKKIIIPVMFILFIFILFLLITYKNQKNGNTMNNKSIDDIVRNVLNISSYQAEIEVTIISNKTTNQYKLRQEYKNNHEWRQTILEPKELENLMISYDGNSITLENTNLGLNKLYENYEDYHYIHQNTLWLNSFVRGFTEDSKITENEDEIMVENQQYRNPYNEKQILYISKKSKQPTKMEIQDTNKNNTIYIKYNEIQLNK